MELHFRLVLSISIWTLSILFLISFVIGLEVWVRPIDKNTGVIASTVIDCKTLSDICRGYSCHGGPKIQQCVTFEYECYYNEIAVVINSHNFILNTSKYDSSLTANQECFERYKEQRSVNCYYDKRDMNNTLSFYLPPEYEEAKGIVTVLGYFSALFGIIGFLSVLQ